MVSGHRAGGYAAAWQARSDDSYQGIAEAVPRTSQNPTAVYKPAIDMFQQSLRLNEQKGAHDDPSVYYRLRLAYENVNQPAQTRQGVGACAEDRSEKRRRKKRRCHL
jgi:hypothetical protein